MVTIFVSEFSLGKTARQAKGGSHLRRKKQGRESKSYEGNPNSKRGGTPYVRIQNRTMLDTQLDVKVRRHIRRVFPVV